MEKPFGHVFILQIQIVHLWAKWVSYYILHWYQICVKEIIYKQKHFILLL